MTRKIDPVTQVSLEAAADAVDEIPVTFSEMKALWVGMANMIAATYANVNRLVTSHSKGKSNLPRTSGPVALVPLLPCKSIDPIIKTVTVDAQRFRAWVEELTATKVEGGLINAVVTVDGYLEVTFEGMPDGSM